MKPKKFASLLSLPTCLFIMLLAACTPEYVRQQSKEVAGEAHVLDSISVERQNQRLLSHQTQICLVSASGGEEGGAQLLQTIQAGFSGYFFVVGVVGESIDYVRAVSTTPCPGASYIFYVQPVPEPCDGNEACAGPSQFIITVVNGGDNSLADRIQLTIKKSFLLRSDERERLKKGFEQLAIVLTGGK